MSKKAWTPQLRLGEEVAEMSAREPGPELSAVPGVRPSATTRVITSAFRARVREIRPDTRVDAATEVTINPQRFVRAPAAWIEGATEQTAAPDVSAVPSTVTAAGDDLLNEVLLQLPAGYDLLFGHPRPT